VVHVNGYHCEVEGLSPAKEVVMKVVGTGSPTMLTIRLKTCEIPVLRDELEERRAVAIEAASDAQRGATVRDATISGDEGDGEELLLISRLLDDLRTRVQDDQPLEIVGPTWLLDQVIRGAAGEAVERLRLAVDAFRLDRGRVTPDEVRGAIDAVCASTATLIGLDHAINHAVDG
jgi:hypothetical protein